MAYHRCRVSAITTGIVAKDSTVAADHAIGFSSNNLATMAESR
jgi:hypothetical protein